jgi:hypothetical protein
MAHWRPGRASVGERIEVRLVRVARRRWRRLPRAEHDCRIRVFEVDADAPRRHDEADVVATARGKREADVLEWARAVQILTVDREYAKRRAAHGEPAHRAVRVDEP